MSAFSTMDDASLAATISAMRDGIAVGNAPLRDSLMPAIRARLRRRELAQNFLDKAEEALRYGGETALPDTDLPVPDGPGVPRGRVVEGERDPRLSRGYHP